MGFFKQHWRGLFSFIAAVVILPVAGEWFVELARERGFYSHPSEKLEGAMTLIFSIAGSSAFRGLALVLVGVVIGIWLDTFVRQNERGSWKRRFRLPVSPETTRRIEQFFLFNLVPACDAQIAFYEAVAKHYCTDKHAAHLAMLGLQQKLTEMSGWRQYIDLVNRLNCSPPLDVSVDEFISCISTLEQSDYSKLRMSLEEFLDRNGSSIEFKNYPELAKLCDNARVWHEKLVASFEGVKSDRRFKSLYRPSRASRWS